MLLKNIFETPNDRLIGITDGVYAIAMTILALEIVVPSITEITSNAVMNQFFVTYLIPAFVMYLISFFVVSSYWENSLLLFGFEEVDTFVQNLNFIALALVCLLPFATGFVFNFSNYYQPNVLFASINLIIALVYLLMFVHVFRKRNKRLLDENNILSLTEANEKMQVYYEENIKLNFTKEELAEKYPHFRKGFGASILTLFQLVILPVIVSALALVFSFISPQLCIFTYILLIIVRVLIKFHRKTNFDFNEINNFTPEELELMKRYKEFKERNNSI